VPLFCPARGRYSGHRQPDSRIPHHDALPAWRRLRPPGRDRRLPRRPGDRPVGPSRTLQPDGQAAARHRRVAADGGDAGIGRRRWRGCRRGRWRRRGPAGGGLCRAGRPALLPARGAGPRADRQDRGDPASASPARGQDRQARPGRRVPVPADREGRADGRRPGCSSRSRRYRRSCGDPGAGHSRRNAWRGRGGRPAPRDRAERLQRPGAAAAGRRAARRRAPAGRTANSPTGCCSRPSAGNPISGRQRPP